MPFGLTNAPATFQHLMETCLGELHLNWSIIYLDDIIIFSKTPQEHLKWLQGVFEHLAQLGLKLKPSKCEFFRDSLRYLGHIVSKKGIASDPKKIETILNRPRPKMVTDVRSFTGFSNYYCKYIKNYAKITSPLYELTSGENSKKKRHNINWTNRCQQSFDHLKEQCSQCPVDTPTPKCHGIRSLLFVLFLLKLQVVPHGTKGTGPKFVTRPLCMSF